MIGFLATLFGLAFGGWAVITVENLPDTFVAGKTTNLTFSVRQHGESLMPDLQPTVVMRSGRAEKVIRAVKTNRPGFYTAGVKLPEAGDWVITIHSNFGRSKLELQPIAAIANGARPVSMTHEARGRRLFVAKGCASCHTHAAVAGSGVLEVGPELTTQRLAADYLEKFLADPSIKPARAGTPRMPNLELKSSEIASLIAFLNSGQRQELSARDADIKR